MYLEDRGRGEWRLDLDVVPSASDQVNGTSTLFDSSSELNDLTVYYRAHSADGGAAVCFVGGHDPDNYADLGCQEL